MTHHGMSSEFQFCGPSILASATVLKVNDAVHAVYRKNVEATGNIAKAIPTFMRGSSRLLVVIHSVISPRVVFLACHHFVVSQVSVVFTRSQFQCRKPCSTFFVQWNKEKAIYSFDLQQELSRPDIF